MGTDKCPDEPSERPFSRILMNPPFAISEPEREFVDYALKQMRPGGFLFAILPNGPITGNNDKHWRRALIERHTVRAVVRFRDDLFMPNVHKGTYGLILEAWRPHKPGDRVFFAFLHDDNNASQKSKMLGVGKAKDNMDRITSDLKRFMTDVRSIIEHVPKESAVARIKTGGHCDLASEAYLESDIPNVRTVQPVEGLFD